MNVTRSYALPPSESFIEDFSKPGEWERFVKKCFLVAYKQGNPLKDITYLLKEVSEAKRARAVT